MVGTVEISDIRNDPNIPDEIKELVIALIAKLHIVESQIAGTMELAYRRGIQAGKEDR